jgi:hypothetical protein
MPLFQSIPDLAAGADVLRRRRYGVIETRGGVLHRVHLRPWPKLVSWPELWWVPWRYHERGDADRCLLYYNQPLRHSRFLSLKYVATTHGTSYRTFREALRVLDTIAAIKRSDAVLCDVANGRISDRLLARLGWEPHKPQRWHRNYIKRFYGNYPAEALANPQRNVSHATNKALAASEASVPSRI